MRPLRLEMQAFGPFARLQVIDFSELGSKTFFLIHGPTGSGKTTLLDGLCFALYGDASGGEREPRDMRSHHAAADRLTQVEFTFSLGDQHYRVRRVPEQRRPARRGDKEVTQAKEAELIALAEGRVLADRWEKVTAAVEGLLGLTSQQFRQIILLPQGRFFEFLKSSSIDRERILQTLFGTEFYKRIEQRLKDDALVAEREAAAVLQTRQALLEQAQLPDAAALATELARCEQHWVDARQHQSATQTALEQSQATLNAARATAERLDELAQARSALDGLVATKPQRMQREQTLQRAQAAAALQPEVLAAAQLRLQAEHAAQQVLELHTRHTQAVQQAHAARQAREAALTRGPERDGLAAQALEMQRLMAQVQGLELARTAVLQAQKGLTQAEADLKRHQQVLQHTEQAAVTQRTEVQGLRDRAALLEAARARHAELQRLVARQARLAQAKADQGPLDTAEREAKAQAQQALEQLEQGREGLRALQRAWMQGQAARLALHLHQGEPCPVCGSLEHPASAQAGELITDEALHAAQQRLQQSETALQQAQARLLETGTAAQAGRAALAALQAELTDAQWPDPCPGDPDEEATGQASRVASTAARPTAQPHSASIEALAAAAAQLAQAQAAAEQLATQQARLEALEGQVQQAREAERQAALAQQSAAQTQAGAQAVLDERTQGVPPAWRTPQAVQTELERLNRERLAIDAQLTQTEQADASAQATLMQTEARWQAAQTAARQRESEAAAAHQALAKRLLEAGFADALAHQQASLNEQDRAALEQALQEERNAMAAAQDRFKRAQAAAGLLVRPDLDALQALQLKAEQAQQEAIAASARAEAALATLQTTARKLADLGERAAQLEQRFALVRGLADLASGQNPQRLSLQRYVLATLFEEVLAATTLRLAVMSRGRYELRRRYQVTDQRSAGGLDLEVFDQYTGLQRPVSTLSGGESFMASLALALGLSDVVQSHAGGIHLDAIFVDEGFGTLDAEALEWAIRALKDLQRTGRLVGIISHVSELRDWIDARLELRREAAGSVATFVI